VYRYSENAANLLGVLGAPDVVLPLRNGELAREGVTAVGGVAAVEGPLCVLCP
jgi:hypothetical protein